MSIASRQMEPSPVPFESYLLSLKADDALAACVLAFGIGLPGLTALFALGFGGLVSPRVGG